MCLSHRVLSVSVDNFRKTFCHLLTIVIIKNMLSLFASPIPTSVITLNNEIEKYQKKITETQVEMVELLYSEYVEGNQPSYRIDPRGYDKHMKLFRKHGKIRKVRTVEEKRKYQASYYRTHVQPARLKKISTCSTKQDANKIIYY
jgi:hypothetical protein